MTDSTLSPEATARVFDQVEAELAASQRERQTGAQTAPEAAPDAEPVETHKRPLNDAQMRAQLAGKLMRVTRDVTSVKPTGYNNDIKKAYADVDDVANAVMPYLIREGIELAMIVEKIERFDTGDATSRGSAFIVTRLFMTFIFTDSDTGYQSIRPWVSEAADHMKDKGIPKALTIARRTFMLHTFQIIAGEEKSLWSDSPAPEAAQRNQPAPEARYTEPARRPAPSGQQPAQQPAARAEARPAPAQPAQRPPAPASQDQGLPPIVGIVTKATAIAGGKVAVSVSTGPDDSVNAVILSDVLNGRQIAQGDRLTMSGGEWQASPNDPKKRFYVPESVEIKA